MPMEAQYTDKEPTREKVDDLEGSTVIEFGAPWCGYCQAAQPLIAEAFSAHPAIRHLKIEDGRGRRLGRSFGVKLWPTLIFLKEGQEIARLVRPTDQQEINQSMACIDD